MDAVAAIPGAGLARVPTCREAVGVFGDLQSAQQAVEELQSCGFNRADISTLARMSTVESTLGHPLADVRELEDEPNAERSIFISRRSLGDAEGLLIAAGIYIGAVLGAGFWASAGASDQGIILAVVIFGGIGALLGYAIAHRLGRRYDGWFDDQLRRGGILVWATVRSPEQDERAVGIMRASGGRDVHIHELPASVGIRLRAAERLTESGSPDGQFAPDIRAKVAPSSPVMPGSAAGAAAATGHPVQNRPAEFSFDDYYEDLPRQPLFQWPAAATSASRVRPTVRRIGIADLRDVLAKGRDDFLETPTQLIFLGIIYPVVGFVAATAASGGDWLALLYPLVAGLSLMGPVAAVGIYELSRRREQGLPVSWVNALDVRHSRSWFSIMALGAVLLAIFVAWIAAARAIFEATLGTAPDSIGAFARQLFTTHEGWMLILLGNGVGFLFAALVLVLAVVSFPLLLDRDVGPIEAMRTSVRAVLANPGPMAAWGLIVAFLLVIGSLPFFIGLAVVMPVLGHATWHLYRKVVAP